MPAKDKLSKMETTILTTALFKTLKYHETESYTYKRDFMWNMLYKTIIGDEYPKITIKVLRERLGDKEIDILLVKIYDKYLKEKYSGK